VCEKSKELSSGPYAATAWGVEQTE